MLPSLSGRNHSNNLYFLGASQQVQNGGEPHTLPKTDLSNSLTLTPPKKSGKNLVDRDNKHGANLLNVISMVIQAHDLPSTKPHGNKFLTTKVNTFWNKSLFESVALFIVGAVILIKKILWVLL